MLKYFGGDLTRIHDVIVFEQFYSHGLILELSGGDGDLYLANAIDHRPRRSLKRFDGYVGLPVSRADTHDNDLKIALA